MRTGITFPIIILILLCSCSDNPALQQTKSYGPPSLSAQRVLTRFSEAVPGSSMHSLRLSPDWHRRARIQPITFQTGIWYIHIQRDTTIFRIYPDENSLANIVVKIDRPDLTVRQLIAATGQAPDTPLNLLEFAVHWPGKPAIHKTVKTDG